MRKSDIGEYYSLVRRMSERSGFDLSYLSRDWSDTEQWRAMARSKVHELLGYFPGHAALEPVTVKIAERDGYREEEIRLQLSAGMETTASVLVPRGEGPFPCVIALHDHGGFYYFGREKIIDTDRVPGPLADIRRELYEGRPWASELSRRGYVVITIDAFYFGSRKLDLDTVSDAVLERLGCRIQDGMKADESIRTANEGLRRFEAMMVKHLLAAGVTWPGILFHDDRKTVEYALTRPEVDPERIGCCGLSLGAFRSVHLFGLDPRIRCAAAVGFMPAYGELQFDALKDHTYMVYTPGLYAYLDHPDIAGLSVPKPLLIQQCSRDALFTPAGMEAAADKLTAIYRKAGADGRLTVTWHDTPHCFTIGMQEQAFDWLDHHLKS